MNIIELYSKIGNYDQALIRLEEERLHKHLSRVPEQLRTLVEKLILNIDEKVYAQAFNSVCCLCEEMDTVGITYNIDYLHLLREVLYLLNFHLEDDNRDDLFKSVCSYYQVPFDKCRNILEFDYGFYANGVKESIRTISTYVNEYLNSYETIKPVEEVKVVEEVPVEETFIIPFIEKFNDEPIVNEEQTELETADEVTKIEAVQEVVAETEETAEVTEKLETEAEEVAEELATEEVEKEEETLNAENEEVVDETVAEETKLEEEQTSEEVIEETDKTEDTQSDLLSDESSFGSDFVLFDEEESEEAVESVFDKDFKLFDEE